MSAVSEDRRALLERLGAFYARERFAILWTATNDPSRGDPKAVATAAWQTTRPLADPAFAAGLFAVRGQTRNPAVTARTSNLILLDCDTAEGLAELQALSLPATLTVRSSAADYKRHSYFRPPARAERLPFVGFRFEEEGFRGDGQRYLVCPPAIHPSGTVYAFLSGRGPGEVAIAELPLDVYQQLVRRVAGARQEAQREPVTPGGKIRAGQRRESIFRYACMLRRWETDREAIAAECRRWNGAWCEPPVAQLLVERQVDGAMRMAGGQELRRVRR